MRANVRIVLGAVTILLGMNAVSHAGLVAHWKLDDAVGGTTVVDSTGNGLDAAQTGTATGPTLGSVGLDGTASSFADANYWLSGNNGQPPPRNYTVSFWTKLESGTKTWRTAVSNRTDDKNGFIFYRYNNGNRMEFWSYGGGWNAQATPNVTDFTKWYHVVGSYDDSTQEKKLYFHAEGDSWAGATGTMTTAGTYIVKDAPVALGARGVDGQLPWGAGNAQLLDDVQYYDEVLTETQVQALFKNPGTTVAAPSTMSPVISLGADYSYSSEPGYQAGANSAAYYEDQAHSLDAGVGANAFAGAGVFATGDLTDGASFPLGNNVLDVPNELVVIHNADNSDRPVDIVVDLGGMFVIDDINIGSYLFPAYGMGAPDDVTVSFSLDNVTFSDDLTESFIASTIGNYQFDIPMPRTIAQFVKFAFDGGEAGGVGDRYSFDEISIRGVAYVPEPSTFLLSALGLFGLALLTRRRQQG